MKNPLEMAKKLDYQNKLNDMSKKYLTYSTFLLLLLFLVLFMQACNYKRAKHFMPTDSIPGQINVITPKLVYPPDGSMDLDRNLTFEWQMVDQATAYDLQIIKEGESFQNANGLSQSGLTSNMYPVKGLEYQTNYQWRVRATAGEITSDWSAAWGLTTKEEPPTFFELSVSKEGEGSVSSAPSGINCGDDCTEDYEQGTEVTLTAEPDPGYKLDSWSGDVPEGCTGDSENCTIVMDNDKTVVATFVEKALFFPNPVICVQHGTNSSEILWLFIFDEIFGRGNLTIVMRIYIYPNDSFEDIEVQTLEEFQEILFELNINSFGMYDWEIIDVVHQETGENIPFEGTTKGEVDVGAEEQNPDECTE